MVRGNFDLHEFPSSSIVGSGKSELIIGRSVALFNTEKSIADALAELKIVSSKAAEATKVLPIISLLKTEFLISVQHVKIFNKKIFFFRKT